MYCMEERIVIMKALILSCNTGGGHNAAGAALKEMLEERGHEAILLDYLTLAGKWTSSLVGDLYIDVVKKAPRVFGAAYKLGMFVSRTAKKSPVYYVNTLMAKYLNRYLKEHPVDVIFMPHLYPSETISYMKKKGMPLPLTVAVMTDYTCIPFWEETCCDYYIVPHPELIEECARRGIPKEKMIPFGIPVRKCFQNLMDQEEAKEKLGFSPEKKLHLLIGGSMGAGNLEKLTREVRKRNGEDSVLAVICGNNEKVREQLEKHFEGDSSVSIIGYTDQMPLYMAAADIVYTKPGGLTSTETAVAGKPLIHTFPIPGCETENRKFFASHGMCMYAHSPSALAKTGVKLLQAPDIQEKMKKAQHRHIRGEAAEDIIRFAERHIRPWK